MACCALAMASFNPPNEGFPGRTYFPSLLSLLTMPLIQSSNGVTSSLIFSGTLTTISCISKPARYFSIMGSLAVLMCILSIFNLSQISATISVFDPGLAVIPNSNGFFDLELYSSAVWAIACFPVL